MRLLGQPRRLFLVERDGDPARVVPRSTFTMSNHPRPRLSLEEKFPVTQPLVRIRLPLSEVRVEGLAERQLVLGSLLAEERHRATQGERASSEA